MLIQIVIGEESNQRAVMNTKGERGGGQPKTGVFEIAILKLSLEE